MCGIPTVDKGDWGPACMGSDGMERREVGQGAKQLGRSERRLSQVRGGTPEGAGWRGSSGLGGLGCEGLGHRSLPHITGVLACVWSPRRGATRESFGRSAAVVTPWVDHKCEQVRGACRWPGKGPTYSAAYTVSWRQGWSNARPTFKGPCAGQRHRFG